MQNRRKIIFIGGVGKPDQFGGELTKNKNIIKRLRDCNHDVRVIDTFKCSHSFIRLISVVLRFLYNIIFCRRSTFVFSSSLGNVYSMLKIMYYIPIKYRIIYWGIGGAFSAKIQEGIYNRRYFVPLYKIIVEGEKMRRELVACGLHNTLVMPNFKEIGELPMGNKYDDDKIHFLFISRIRADKGVSYIMDCVERLNKAGYTDVFCVDFYGQIDADYTDYFQMHINKFDNVRYAGTIDLSDSSNYSKLARYHFMLFPTYWSGEGFPGVVIDAYIAGVPIIASDWSMNKEFITDKETGIIVETHSCDQLYMAMSDVLACRYEIDYMIEKCQASAYMYDTSHVLSENILSELFT